MAGLTPTVAALALRYFALVFGAGFLLAFVRVPLLVPRFGERVAELIEIPVMLAVIVAAARWLVRRHGRAVAPGAWAAVGGLALAFLVAAELLVGYALLGRTPLEVVLERDPVSGTAYALSLVAFAAMPRLFARRG